MLGLKFVGSANPSSPTSPFTGSSEALFIGKPDTSATWGLALYNAQSDSGATTGSQLSTIPVGEQVFFVVRIVNEASSGQITAWLNPSLDGEPATDTAFYDNKTAGHTADRVLFDRIRISGAGAVYNKLGQVLDQGGVPTFLEASRAMAALNAFIRYRLSRDAGQRSEWLR